MDDTIDLIDQLAAIRALIGCASMACHAIDDGEQSDALLTLLAHVEDLIRQAAAQASAASALAA